MRLYLSLSERVFAWITPRSQRARFLRGFACLWPNTSTATAPSIRNSRKSSVTDTSRVCRSRKTHEDGQRAQMQCFTPCVSVFTLQLSNTTRLCGSLLLRAIRPTSGAINTGSCCSQKRYWQKTKLERCWGNPVACDTLIWKQTHRKHSRPALKYRNMTCAGKMSSYFHVLH